MININNYQELIEKVDNLKKQDKMDLSSDQDLSIAIMNLISIEEHFFFTAEKTGKSKYFDLLQEVRAMRGELLKKIVKDSEGEIWCISKHLLGASMRLMEVGTKQHKTGNKEEAENLFKKSFDLYSLFWGVNMGVINSETAKEITNEELMTNDKFPMTNQDQKLNDKNNTKTGLMAKMSAIVKKIVDCCIE